MNEQEIIQYALHNLVEEDITGEWKDITDDNRIDGKLVLHFKYHPPVHFNVDVKKELRAMHVDYFEHLAKEKNPFLVVANRIFPKVKQELKNRRINYLEANGNMFLFHDGLYVNINGKRNRELATNTGGNRAFTKTGLKVIYQFLLNEEIVNWNYRDIAAYTGTGLGNINNIFNGLKQEGYLIQLTKNDYKLDNKLKLLEKWIIDYERKLKPTLAIGSFRFLKPDDFYNWKNIPIKRGQTFWGGEPAGDLFTNYLRPEELTLYTTEERTDLIKNYRLVPDIQGNVKVFKTFWITDEVNDNVVQPLLAYADLIAKGDRRCTETAQKIYDEYLQNKF
ncbi:type IV toxin-antitoxin system AbiEi family antitoxin [Flavobacterium lacus]|uniref:Uncharacterized protein n=1 Tax=Flavobacterium lacus TaxID=1353778 RepID=A0A328WJV4_9FLAO|nr:type IV toxin-antitoxin system AbiEi family antitoxin [Flavobacterium lacus]RAR46503.1 hypothetical protein B0I10_11838 [Flavobacterium lacus]